VPKLCLNIHGRKYMIQLSKEAQFLETPNLGVNEQREIDKKIAFETAKSFHSMVKLGAFANIIGAFLYILMIYSSTKPWLAIIWYCALVSANLINILWALGFEYNNITPREILKCRQGFFYIVMGICLIWGSIGILFMSDRYQQITTIIFLSAVLICFAFSTAIDLTIGIISIICLLLPTITYHSYLALSINSLTNNFHLPLIAAFIILGLFMLMACFLGNKIVIKVFRLGYENALLSQKLANINTVLEEKVKKRTQELETSLKIVRYQATHDLLTELPNERFLYEYFNTVRERAATNHYKFVVASFSLNGMMKINDSIGHQASNLIISRVARRFSDLFKNNKRYFVSLLRQDVFVILIEPIKSLVEIEPFVEYLFAVLNNPVYIQQQSLQLKGSIGVSVYPDNGLDIDKLITNAEAARVTATQHGGNSTCIYSSAINADASRQLNIENLLYQVIKNNELILNYQPIIDLQTEEVYGAEALVRWKSPVLGLVSPLDFIPVAEVNGMIIPIGEWVLHTACEQLKKWKDSGFKSFQISINLSAKQLVQKNLIDQIEEILNKFQLVPQDLELELTESNAFHNEFIPVVHKFTKMGISLAIDDFGTGYSEFSNLKLLAVNKIKIDRTFIEDIDFNVDSRNIVCNTISLAKSMNIKCLAEGVETIEQLNFLKRNGCNLVQGYYFSPPLSAKEFLKFLKRHAKAQKSKLTKKLESE
jgi:diguanylate cyclase (GGDEF)-like protein